jgi:hypothetical protein
MVSLWRGIKWGSSSPRKLPWLLSLPSIVEELKLCRSLCLATQITPYLKNWKRSPIYIPPKEFWFPPLCPPWNLLCEKEVIPKLALSKSFVVIVGSLKLSCGIVLQPLCKCFGRHLQDHHLVERELASMACSPEKQGEPLWCWWTSCHLSNINVLPNKEGATGYTSSCLHCSYLMPLPSLLSLFSLLVVSCHFGLLT